MIKVGVLGARGRMGRTVCEAIEGAPDASVVAQVDQGDPLDGLLGCDVVVDFTRAQAAFANAKVALAAGVSPVIGTTGMTPDQVGELRCMAEARRVGAVVAPNFALGAVLLMRFAAQAARHLPEVEIIELHHDGRSTRPRAPR